jgi:hypothetical protein
MVMKNEKRDGVDPSLMMKINYPIKANATMAGCHPVAVQVLPCNLRHWLVSGK